MLNIFDVSIALKGEVKYMAEKLGMGVEFHEIRQGDRPLLNYVLHQLGKRPVEDFADLEVVTEPHDPGCGRGSPSNRRGVVRHP